MTPVDVEVAWLEDDADLVDGEAALLGDVAALIGDIAALLEDIATLDSLALLPPHPN